MRIHNNRRLPCVFFVIAGLIMLVPVWNMSYVYNENGRLASGVIYLKTGDYASFHVNPPLVSLLGALPATLAGAKHPTRGELGISSFARDEYKAGDIFIEKNPNNRVLLFIGRLCCIILILGCFGFAFRFTHALYGTVAAYLFLGAGLFSPYILGYGPLIVPDVPSALLGTVSVCFFLRWMRSPDKENAFLAGITLGLAELTKFTLLVFYPLFVAMWGVYRFSWRKNSSASDTKSQVPIRQELVQLLLIATMSLIVINMGYFFEGTGQQLRDFKFQTTLFTGVKTLNEVPDCGGNRFDGSKSIVETALGYVPIPLPKNFVQGIDTQRLDFENGITSYLRGEWSDHGWGYYYLYALLIKTPIGTLGFFVLAIVCSLFLKGYNAPWRDEMTILLPGIVILVFVSSQTGFSIHSRYVIPALPFFFIWISKVGRSFSENVQKMNPRSTIFIRILTIVFLVGSVASSLSIYPHSISYFNELAAILPTPEDTNYPKPFKSSKTLWQKTINVLHAGPRNGPRHLLDSNIDWGQDLFYLERWCEKRPEITNLNVTYWGSYPLELTKIPSNGTPLDNDPQPGWYALSVNHIYDRTKQYRYFLYYEPVATAGHSIYVYHITRNEANRVRRELGLPEIEEKVKDE